MEEIKYPYDLAGVVEAELKLKGVEDPSKVTLAKIFEIIYFSSLKTEDLQHISCSLTYINPNNPDPKPPGIYSSVKQYLKKLDSIDSAKLIVLGT